MIPPPPISTLFPYTTLFRSSLFQRVHARLSEGQTAGRIPEGGFDAGRHARDVSPAATRSEEHTSELQSQSNLACRLLLEKKKKTRSSIDGSRESGPPGSRLR